MNDLEKLFISELGAVYDAEGQLAQALAEMEKSAISPELKSAFGRKRQQAESHAVRLREVFNALGHPPKPKTCHGIRGIIKEAQTLVSELEGHAAIDAALIAVAEKGVHFTICAYGTLCTWADELDRERAAGLLKQNLGEAKDACTELTRLAETAQRAEIKDQHELQRLLVRQLRLVLDGEHLLVSALAEVEFYAVSRLLKLAVHYHQWQTKRHVRRLEEVFSELRETADRRPCDGIEGIIDDAQVAVMEFLGNAALDAALIASAQKAERYEIAAYQNLGRWAAQLDQSRVRHLLTDNLSDEIATDRKLSLAAETLRNRHARAGDSAKRPQETAELLKLATHGE